jgi:hypothetical protein
VCARAFVFASLTERIRGCCRLPSCRRTGAMPRFHCKPRCRWQLWCVFSVAALCAALMLFCVQAAGAPGVTAAVPAEVPVVGVKSLTRVFNCLLCVLTPWQAVEASVSLVAVLDSLATLNLNAHADPVAAHLCDNGFEDRVPISGLVKLLRDAGVPPARAVAVKNAVTTNRVSLVSFCSTCELLCVICHGTLACPAGCCSHANCAAATSSCCPCARGVPVLLL